ncbi:cell wall hydrolase [Sphingomonas arenae]|uniref:cell wall hydrolase n=1 Tax=Sphingomonas arenae TaxID=2812555 RepID=UPI001968A2C6|nr:cell wall hydrolase [Sphingomonas arenae]
MNVHSSHRPVRHLSVGPRRSRLFLVGSVLTLAAIAGLIAVLFWPASERLEDRATKAEVSVHSAEPALKIDLPPPDLLRPLSPEEAKLENEKRPFTSGPVAPARPFKLSADAISRLRAVDCLTQAIYYEAASEGVEGGRAVAQVVLNRVRHPAYPNTVCGVVYQGSTRSTGCQFTFTCDGSLLRPPSAYLWARSHALAVEALAGRVYAPVGYATHYHADYVVPYWADSLEKMTQIGRHIFYRLRGSLGSARAYNQRHPGVEPPPVSAGTSAAVLEEALKVTEDTDQPLAPVAEDTSAKPIVDDQPIPSLQPEASLAVDSARGTLILDGDAPPAPPAQPKARSTKAEQDSCKSSRPGTSVEAVRANELRVGRPSSC